MSIPEEANGHASETSKNSTPSKDSLDSETPATQDATPKPAPAGEPNDKGAQPSPISKPNRNPKPRPNYTLLHSRPLPLTIHPLPAFHPTHPFSLLRLTYTYLTHLFSPPSSHLGTPFSGLFSPRTRSVHITDPAQVRALWEMGFWGKGSLSRSEPSWMEREKERREREKGGGDVGVKGGGAEAATARRREARRLFKLERARVEREKIERQRAVEQGSMDVDAGADVVEKVASDGIRENDGQVLSEVTTEAAKGHITPKALYEGRVPDADIPQLPDPDTQNSAPSKPSAATTTTSSTPQNNLTKGSTADTKAETDETPTFPNQEHLHLTLEESLYLTYSLGLLTTFPPPPSLNPTPHHPGPSPYSTTDLLFLSCHHSTFPPANPGTGIAPDDPFLLNYVTYHHFRSLGWVVRSGVKFGCDYLLYNRGPVFSHAEFAVLIIPSYTHRYWNTPGGRSRRRVHYPGENTNFSALVDDGGSNPTSTSAGGDGKDWWFLHCVNRVQSQVRKSLVLCYVDVPSPWEVGLDDEWDVDVDVGRLLRGYRVREFVVRRWVVNRMRD